MSSRRKLWPGLLLSGAALGLLSCDRAPWARPRHLLLITVDTLRADRIGSYGYEPARTPHLDGLAARGLRFHRATTVVPLTLPAHASLMTGTFPSYHGVRDNGGFYLGDEHQTLAERLRTAGFRTAGFVGAFVLDSRWGIGQGFERFVDDFDLTEYEDVPGMDAIQRPASAVVDRALEWLDRDHQHPFFAWVHLYDPHTPYLAPAAFQSHFPATRSGAYDAEIAYTDSQIGRLLEALEEQGRLEETLVVVLSDHGEMLGEHGEATHGFFIYDAAVRIPLLIAGPGVPAAEVEAPVRIVDVLPTALAQLGLEVPEAVQGVDLTPLFSGRELALVSHYESWYPRYHYGWSELRAIQDGHFKFIRAPERELYNLAADPGELDNLAEEDPERVKTMERQLERLIDGLSRVDADAAATRPLDSATAERLAALGYLTSGSDRHREERPDDLPRGDPKEKIGLYNRLKEASAAGARGDYEAAVALTQEVLDLDPGVVEAHLLRGNFERKRGRLEAAAQAYRDALATDPEHREALYRLAVAYKGMGRFDDSLAGLERALSLDPKNANVLWQLADVHMKRRDFTAAKGRLEGALGLDLDRPRFLLKLGACLLEMGEPEAATRRLQEALRADSDLRGAHFHLGLAFEDQGRPADAIVAYRSEIELHDDAERARFNLARLLLDRGRPREALRELRKTLEAQPHFGTGYLYLAKALLDVGDLEAAERAARRGLSEEPEAQIAPLGHFVLADIYHRLGRTEEAIQEEAAGRLRQRQADPE